MYDEFMLEFWNYKNIIYWVIVMIIYELLLVLKIQL